MDFVVTLVCDPAARRTTPEAAEAARQAVEEAGGEPGAADWLCPGVACDIPCGHGDRAALERAVREALAERPIDVVVQGSDERKKRLLVADMESTIIENEMVDELAELVGVGHRVAEITRRAMNGEIGFRTALAERVALLGGLEADLLKGMRDTIRFMPGARALVATMRANGAKTALVSGGFKVYSKWVKRRLGFHKHFANDLILRDGVVTGEIKEPILGREGKLEALDRLIRKYGLDRSDVLAVGDGANDLMMLDSAGSGVAFRAKPSVAAQARIRVDYGDLTGLLYLQGYRRDEFAES